MGDHGEPSQAEEVRAAVRVGVEALPEVPCRGPDQKAAYLAARRCPDLLAHALEQRADRALEELQADVPREAVADDDVARVRGASGGSRHCRRSGGRSRRAAHAPRA